MQAKSRRGTSEKIQRTGKVRGLDSQVNLTMRLIATPDSRSRAIASIMPCRRSGRNR